MSPTWRHTLAASGRYFLASALLAFGIQHLVYGKFVTRLIPAWPIAFPSETLAAYGFGLLLVAAALAIAFSRFSQAVALTFSAVCLVSVLSLHLPPAFHGPAWGGQWTNAGKALSFSAAGLLLARSYCRTGGQASLSCSNAAFLAARIFFALFLILGGIQHFLWWQFVQTLVPSWIPGAKFWTFFAGVALIAGGVGLLVPRLVRPAAVLTGLMIFSWVLLLHIPRALANLHDANETTAVFEALAFAGLSWLIASTSSPAEPSTARIVPAALQ
jgi:uncharacterized membrane protein YphA (DoxX/SURF4 family)